MAEHIYSVSDITADIRGSLEEQFQKVWIEGEISNHRLPGSGHHYFTLKDEFAQLSCVLFRGAAAKLPVQLKDGMKVQLLGSISVYEARGQYQLIAQLIQPTGFGDLQAKFEALKRKLEAEGLFDPGRKKNLPVFPRTIGIVTSPTGAAIRDILNVLARRAPWIRVMVYPARVQGEGAAEEIVAGVEFFDRAEGIPEPDLILLARGGGSIEDLWAFNEEVLARAIARCSIPVLSGVGHEIDFTIADFVADRREPTPSAAAENATPDGDSLKQHLAVLHSALEGQVGRSLSKRRQAAEALQRELAAREPRRRVQGWMQSLDFLHDRLIAAVEGRIVMNRRQIEGLKRVFETVQPERELLRARGDLARCRKPFEQVARAHLEKRRELLAHFSSLLNSLAPAATLNRGFSITFDANGKPVSSAGSVNEGERLISRFADGEVRSVVE